MSLILQVLFILSLFSISTSVSAAPDITNTANATYSVNGNGTLQTASSSFTFTQGEVDTLNIKKTSNVSSVFVGGNVTYTLTVTNPTPRDLTNVRVEDTFPTGLVFITNSATLNGTAFNNSDLTITSNVLELNLGTLTANSSVDISYQSTVTSSTPTGSASNNATVFSDTTAPTSAQAIVNILQVAVVQPTVPLVLTKIANVSEANIGDTVTYSLTIKNDNNFNITGAELTDKLPAGLTYINNSALFNNNQISVSVADNHIFSLGSLSANSSNTLSYDVLVGTRTDNLKVLTNQADVKADDTEANSNVATATIAINDDEFTINKTTANTNVFAADQIEYSITITNPLSRDLNNLVIQDTLPTGFIYKAETAKLDNNVISASNITTNNQVIEFELGSLPALSSKTLTYIVDVTENAIPGENTNSAQAVSDYGSSQISEAIVKVRTPSIINFLSINDAGVDSIIQSTAFNTNQNGGKNFEEINSVSLPDGTAITLPSPQPIIDATQYQVDEPVVIEVIDLDQNINSNVLDTIEVTVTIPGTNDTEILLLTETSPNSGVFRGIILTTSDPTSVQNGVLTVANGVTLNVNYRDIEDNNDVSATAALIVPQTQLQISKTANKSTSSIGELVEYTISFSNSTPYELSGLTVKDLLPLGFKYVPNTAELNGSRINNRLSFDGRNLSFGLENMPSGSSWEITYITKVSAGTQIGDAVNTASISNDTFSSNEVQATVVIQDDLMQSSNLLTGRVYIGCETHSNDSKKKLKVLGDARIYMETGRSVLTDTEGFWHMEGVNPGAHVLQLDTESIPGYEPLLCEDNTRRAQDPKSHFVDLHAGNIWHVDFHVKPIVGYKKDDKSVLKSSSNQDPAELFDDKYLNSASEGFDILWPKNNFVPDVASTKIYIKSSPKHKVELFLNGKKINALNYDGSDTNKDRTVTIRRWLGVDIDIDKKDNTLLAILKDKAGKEIARKTHNIHFSSTPASAELLLDKSILIADGKTTPVIALKVKDEDGFPMRANTHGYFSLENNKYSIKTNNTDDDNNRLGLNQSLSGSYKFLVTETGIAKIELNPTTQSGEIKLRFNFTDDNNKTNTTEISAWLKPALREWIMVGIAEGTLAHNKLSGNMQSLEDLDLSDEYSKRGRVAFFAKGQVKGKYLLTIAYDSDKEEQEVGSQLNGNIDPDAYYTVYADNSNSQYDAPSSKKLYLKIEKENFYALFGDYQTDMTKTELGEYQRTLNGIKTEYHGSRFAYKMFVAETSNNHHQDIFPGDGTSGIYRLSNDIIANSESITIETRDRYRSDEIIEQQVLTAYQDYNIDYDTGELYFKFPINKRDGDFNPIYIIVDYDSEENSNKSITAGGRFSVKSKDGKLETGLNLIHEGVNNGVDNKLIATDATYKITPDITIKAEVAQSIHDHEKRNAYILELEKEIENMEASIYLKQKDSSFGINALNSENGTKKMGAEIQYRLKHNTTLNAEARVEKDLIENTESVYSEISISKKIKNYEATIGFKHTQEELKDSNNEIENIENNVFLLGGKYTTKNDKLTLRSDLEKNLSSIDGSELSPDRLIFGADLKLAQGFSVYAEHETTNDDEETVHNNRVGVNKRLWKGAKTNTSYTQERTDEGQRNYATLGLSQTIQLNDKLKADISIDKVKTVEDSQNDPDSSSTNDDYTSFSVGLGSNNKDWSWTTRAEYRDGEVTDKVNFLASAIRHYENGKNLSANLSYYNSDDVDGSYDKTTTISFGSAWHPKEKDYVFFNRLDLISEKSFNSEDGDTNDTKKAVHNLHYQRKLDKKTRIGLHHGIKYVQDEINGTSSTSTIDTATVEVRRDLNKRWDIGVHGGYLRDWDDSATEYVAGVSIGMSPRKNMWVELGYNVEGFNDSDFDSNEYTQEGVYIDFRYKFNQDSFKKDLRNLGNDN